MSKNLRRCIENFQVYCKTHKKSLKTSFLKNMSCDDCYFKAIHEIIHNINVNKLKLSIEDKKKLRKYIKFMTSVLCNPKSRQKRAKLVKQSGGFLNIAIPAVITVLSEILSNVIR